MSTSFEVVIPVLNEEVDLPPSIARLHEFLSHNMGSYDWGILIADNGSTDSTPKVAGQLSQQYPHVTWTRLEQRGRGRALRHAWMGSDAHVVAYMDVDLSTDLSAIPELVDAIAIGGYDVAIGSRLRKGARVVGRPPHREVISRMYNLIIKLMFFTRFQDAQCGFKAVGRRALEDIIPLIQDRGWFFDTELLILAEKNGYRIREVPVRWSDDPDSRVKIVKTAFDDLRGLLRLRFGGLKKASATLSNILEGRES